MTVRIFVAGHRGMVGGAILRLLEERQAEGANISLLTRGHEELDLANQSAVRSFMRAQKPDVVILAAARVGGIHANDTCPAEFIYDNLIIQANVIHQAHAAGIERLLNLGSSCIYPRLARQPMAEGELLKGGLEPTNEPYAVAKIAGIKLCESYNRQHGRDYRSAMPTNLYGPGDNFHPLRSHVLPALIRRFHEARESGAPEVVVWGTGTPRREFLHVEDLAEACLHLLDLDRAAYAENVDPMVSHVNIGTGQDIAIRDLAEMVAGIVGYGGRIVFDASKPDGAPRKLLDVSRLRRMGWTARIPLERGIRETYRWFLSQDPARLRQI